MLLIKLVHSNEQIGFDLNLPGTKGGIGKKNIHIVQTHEGGVE